MSKLIYGRKKMSKKLPDAKSGVVKKINFETKNLKLCLGLLILALGFGYLIQINSLATKGYKIKDLEKQVNELKQAKSDLELDALALQSVGNLKDKMEKMGMVALNKEEYLNAKPVALNR